MTLFRRVLAVLLWLVYVALGGIGGMLVGDLGLALYVLYLLFLWFFSSALLSVLAETLWKSKEV